MGVIVEPDDDGAVICWKESPYGAVFFPKGFIIFRREISTDGGSWTRVDDEPFLAPDRRHYQNDSHSPSSYEFKVAALYETRSSIGKIAEPRVYDEDDDDDDDDDGIVNN